jgi:hypothetical protein
MTKHLTVLIAFLITIGSQASSKDLFFYDHTLTAERVKNLGSVFVHLVDNAGMGCWTNLKESREYAEEKLRIQGIEVGDRNSYPSTSNKNYQFTISVAANRLTDRSSLCTGYMSVALSGYSNVNGVGHLSYLGERSATFVQQNANMVVIDLLKEAFDVFP